MQKWFPSPQKFWVCVIIILCMSSIYTYSQEYKDVQSIQEEFNNINSNMDDIQNSSREIKETVKVPKERDVVITKEVSIRPKHHYHRPSNPIADFFHNVFRSGR